METAAIAKCCEERGIPWSVFRVISDRASDGTVDEEVFQLSNQDGTPNIGGSSATSSATPTTPRLAKMGQQVKLATEPGRPAAHACPHRCLSRSASTARLRARTGSPRPPSRCASGSSPSVDPLHAAPESRASGRPPRAR